MATEIMPMSETINLAAGKGRQKWNKKQSNTIIRDNSNNFLE